jgi:hypothetical protein
MASPGFGRPVGGDQLTFWQFHVPRGAGLHIRKGLTIDRAPSYVRATLEFINLTSYERAALPDVYFAPPRGPPGLFRRLPVRNSCSTGKRLIPEGCLPVPGDDELSAIQKLGFCQEGPSKIGAIKYSFEKVRALEMGT